MLQLIALYGGTFDPIHNGHLAVARTALTTLPIQQIRFIPTYISVHRDQPSANAEQRLTMLKLAIEDNSSFVVDDIEIKRQKPSYTIETLIEIKKIFPKIHFAWILGYDAWTQFHTWHRFTEILNYSHLIIASRPHAALQKGDAQGQLLHLHQTTLPHDLLNHQSGKIFVLENCDFDVSATQIRDKIKQGCLNDLDIPAKVLRYIRGEKLYL